MRCHIMAKPTGSLCNLACDYCFYLDKSTLYPHRKSRCMDDATLENYIIQHIDAQDTDQVLFAWQGGEPTLAGLSFFQKAVDLQQRFSQGKTIQNTFQTNGILLNDEWCRFFHQHAFLVGISIDGDAALHDKYRKTIAGKPTHTRVAEAVSLLNKYHVEFNTLTVVNAVNSCYPLEVYEYLKQLGSRHMQFIPLLESTKEGVSERSVEPEKLATFLKTIFYHWVRQDIGIIELPFFEHTFAAWCGLPAVTCEFAPSCGYAFALELNGDVYQCDHFVSPEYLLGNIHHEHIKDIMASKACKTFGEAKQPQAPECGSCRVKFLCHGGCPKDRIALSSRGLSELNYFCSSYKSFFMYSEPYMLMMKSLHENGYRPADIHQFLAD